MLVDVELCARAPANLAPAARRTELQVSSSAVDERTRIGAADSSGQGRLVRQNECASGPGRCQ